MPPDDNTRRMAKLMDMAMQAQSQEEADGIFVEMLTVARQQSPDVDVPTLTNNLRGHLGYYTGYFGNETRARVEKFFQCEHPFFGAIADTPPPTADEAFTLGMENAARHKRGEPLITLRDMRALIAECRHQGIGMPGCPICDPRGKHD